MPDYKYIGLTGTQAIDNAHAWLLNESNGIEGGAFSRGQHIKYSRAMAMGTDGVFYVAGDDGFVKNVIVKSAFGADIAIWETALTCANYDYSTGVIYEPVNKHIIAISKAGSFNVLSSGGTQTWYFAGISALYGIVSDANGYVYVCGNRKAGQLGEATTASVWKLGWNTGTLRYDVVAYYDTGGHVYDISIDSTGNLLVCGVIVSVKNVWKLTSALALSTSWLIPTFTVLYSCEWLSTGNFVVGGAMPTTQNQVQLINASTGATIWGKIPRTASLATYHIKTVSVDSSDNVHVIYGVEYPE